MHGHVSMHARRVRFAHVPSERFDLLLMLLYSVPQRDPLKVTRRYNFILTSAFCRKRGLRVCLLLLFVFFCLLFSFLFFFLFILFLSVLLLIYFVSFCSSSYY